MMLRESSRKPAARLAALLASAVVLCSLTVARATSPASQYQLFGEGDEAIVDVSTKLTWQRGHAPTTLSYAQAEFYCAALTTKPAKSGYRVPTYRELLSLFDENPRFVSENGAVTKSSIDYNAFPDTQLDVAYWSSTLAVGSVNRIGLEFQEGTVTAPGSGSGLAVRCVAR